MDLQLTGKNCLITGASAGSGAAVAKLLASEGAHVAITARRREKLDELANEIRADHDVTVFPIEGDIMVRSEIERITSEAVKNLGEIDVLVNCAGGSRPISLDDPDAVWQEAMDLNFTSARRFTHAILPSMREKKWGRVINFSGSMEPRTMNAAFSAKAAIHLWSKGLSCEVASEGITVNCIAPGRIATEQIMSKLYPTPEARKAFIEANIPAGDFGQPEDIANAVAFLASQQAKYITGAVLPVDGGMHYFSH